MTEAVHRLADAGWLRAAPLGRVLAALNGGGEEARVVGGAVRNVMLGEPPGDFDIATTAVPDEVVRRAKAAGFKPVPTGIEHGTVTVVADGRPFEVTTLRQDVETDGRRARVAFGRDWQADALRRDFTINALSADPDGAVHDYTGGLADLQSRRVRFIGDASRRIAEDYLRILRFFRFHAAYGAGAPDRDAIAACVAGRAGLAQLSRERVRMELMKLLAAPRAAPALEAMGETGILVAVLGGVVHPGSFARLAELQRALGRPAGAVQRLGALAVWVGEDALRLWQRLRLSNAEHDRLAGMADAWWRVSAGDGRAARALLYRLGAEKYADRVLLAWSRSGAAADDRGWRELLALPERWSVPEFPLRADDFLRRGMAKGPALGAALRAAEEAWIGEDFPADAAALDRIAAAARS